MEHLAHSWTGAFHLSASIIALATGAFVFLNPKGTARHKFIGYGYVVSMLSLNLSALCIYALNGRFNALHVFAILSLITVMSGIVPALLKKLNEGWQSLHYQFMSWSFVGLVSALCAELSVRIPNKPFWTMVSVSSAIVSAAGGAMIFYNVKKFFTKEGKLISL